jgi:hypothetical protein
VNPGEANPYLLDLKFFTGSTIKSTTFWIVTPQFGDTPTYQRNISPPSSGLKRKPTKLLAEEIGKLSFISAVQYADLEI